MAAVIPGLIALVVCFTHGLDYALIGVYLPVLLLFPDDLRWSFVGHLTLSQSALLPIAVMFLIRRGSSWRWSLTDLLVVLMVTFTTLSEYVNQDMSHARNFAIDFAMTTAVPYLLAKGLFERDLLGAAFARRVAICVALVGLVSVWEFRMGLDLFERFINPWFGRALTPRLFRYAYSRIQGPWSQPILAGIIFAGAYRLTRWLEWSGNWQGNVPFLPISKTRFCEILMVMGSIMTVSRGPWLGATAGGICVLLINARRRKFAVFVTLVAIILLGGPVKSAIQSYANINRFEASDTESTAAYRYELLEKYITIVEERPSLGWGNNLFPRIDSLNSVDNNYLLLALDAGLYALATFVGLLLWMIVRLVRLALREPRGSGPMVLAVSLLGTIVMFAVSITTVWLGDQTQPLFYLVIGWSEGLLLGGAAGRATASAENAIAAPVAMFRFARVMV
jgi:hypothetical protein